MLVQSLLVLPTLPREQFPCDAVLAGCAGRHGEDQRAPGGWRATRSLPGAPRQALSSSLVPHARLFSLHPSLVSQNSCLSHGLGAMNSCWSMHGVDLHDISSGMHENSWGALGHRNSCYLHAAGVQGGTKASRMSTRLGVWRLAVEKLASPQQASTKLHVEAWAGLLRNQGLRFSQEEEIVLGCAVAVACPSCPDNSPEPPGPGRVNRNMFGWSQLEKTARSGEWLFRGALRGENIFLPSAQQESGYGRDRTALHGRFLVIPRALVRMRTGEAPLSGHVLESGVGHY